MKKVRLEKIAFGNSRRISRDIYDDLPKFEIKSFFDMMTQEMIAELHGYIWGERKKIETVKWPLNWKEAFKERWLSKWILKKFPVLYEERTYSAEIIFPSIKYECVGHTPIVSILKNGEPIFRRQP